jgi:hypothetical protein
MLAHNDDDLPSNEPIRIKGKRSSNPRRNLKLREAGKRENSKLAKVRGEKHKGKE